MEIKFEDSIRNLNLSVRSSNALFNSGIKTVEQLLNTSEEFIKNIYGLGVKSLDEIGKVKESLKLIHMFDCNYTEKEIRTFIYSDEIEYLDIELEDLGLSRRAYNCLKTNGINYFSELIRLDDEGLMNIRNFGVTSLKEIKKIKKNIELNRVEEVQDKNRKPEILNTNERQFIGKVAQALGINIYEIFRIISDEYTDELKAVKDSNDCNDNTNLLAILFKIDIVKNKFKDLIISEISKTNYGLYIEEITNLIPIEIRNKNIIDQTLNELLDSGKIDFLYDDRLMIKRGSFKQEAFKFLKRREFNILKNRIEGKTLEEVGEIYDVTRERIRQIEGIAKRKLDASRIIFEEDLYKEIFLKYKLDKEDYYLALGSYDIYNFLKIRYGSKGKKEAEGILNDREIPIIIRKKFKKAIYKDYIKVNNDRVKKTRTDLVDYVLKTYTKNDIHFDEFKDIYLTLVEDLNLSDVENIGILDRGYENKLLSSNKVLWKYGRMLRYYDQENYDFTELLKVLNLNQYMDVEYSTLKFFRQYSDLMSDYDIRDEYELHNLLKKICSKQDYPYIKFNRMPNIEFGLANRSKQVKELLYMKAPISNHDFAKEYENEYGVGANTVLANYVGDIEKYFHQGEYVIDFPDIPDDTKYALKAKLLDEIYLMEDVILEAKKIDPEIEREKLNPRSLKSLGFTTYEKYIVSNKYDNAAHYFNHILTNEDLIDIGKIDSRIKQLVSFTAQLYKLKKEYEIIEYAPDKYVNLKRLKTKGINKEMFNDFNKQVLNFLGEGKYFTMAFLREQGFSHYLDKLGFDDWFYTSILIENKEKISYIRVGRNKVMLTGKYGFNFEEFVESIVYKQEDLYIDIYDLDAILKNKYQVYMDIYKLISIIKSSSMHYDEITEQVYADYEIYYEVI